MKRRSLWPLLLASLVGLVILVSLGVWQLQRLSDKQQLLTRLEQRMTVVALPLAEALKEEDADYARVKLSGRYLGVPLRKLSAHNGSPAFQLVQPFLTDSNHLVLVLRGMVPESASPVLNDGPATFEGILRAHDDGQGLFDPDNDPLRNQWNWWDVPEMLAQVEAPADAAPVPYVLHRLPITGDQGPIALPPKAELRNNHLGYAITWFGLAAVLVVMTGLVVLRTRNIS